MMWPQVSTLWVLWAFMEYLHGYGMSHSNINNYRTAIRTMCIIYGQDTAFMRDQRIPLFIKSITINRPLKSSLPLIIDDHIPVHMIQIIQNLEYSIVYQALYLLCFFSFLRLFNILPHSINTFDITRQLLLLMPCAMSFRLLLMNPCFYIPGKVLSFHLLMQWLGSIFKKLLNCVTVS